MNRVDWINALFLGLSPLIAFAGGTFLFIYHGVVLKTVAMALLLGISTGIAVTAGYHRLFAHKSYDARWIFRFIMLMLGAAAFENSARRWASDHRNHHKYVDTDLDPYNIKKGFWFAHMGWVCVKHDPDHKFDNVADLDHDPLIRFQDAHNVLIGVLVGFGLPMGLGALWGDALGGLLIGGFLRVVLNHHFTFAINSFCHMLGKQPYSDRNSSRDSWLPALVTYGEGYHNYHHTFPSDYRNGIRSYHWDPTKWLIKFLHWTGQTYNLRQIPEESVLKARLRMDEKRIILKMEKAKHVIHVRRERIVAARLKLEGAYVHFKALKDEYKRLKKNKWDALSAQWAAINERIDTLRRELRLARQHLKDAFSEWAHLAGTVGVRPTPIYA